MGPDVDWNHAEQENDRLAQQAMPSQANTIHAETVLSHLEQSLAFARAHLTQAETDFQAFKNLVRGR
jgi:hypothetical protein